MARDQRTRLNGELSYRYSGGQRKPARAPGRGAMTDGLEEKQEDEVEVEAEGEQQEVVAADAEQQVAPEPRKSIFELPRKGAQVPSVLPGAASEPGTPDSPAAPSAAPAVPSSTKPTRR